MKQAMVVVSFGTSVPEAMKAIENIEHAAEQVCGQTVYRAFTSRIIRKKLRERDGIDIPDPHTLFEHLIAQGYDSIRCLATHVIAGIEYEQLCADAAQFPQVRMARPLLWSESDYDACVHAVMHSIPARRENEALLLMGHGTEHFANAAYCELEHKFRTEGYANVYVGTVEGYPQLDSIIPQLQAAKIKRIRHDLSGDAPDSWKSRLEALGFETRTVLMGLGEIPEIAQKFAGHLKEME